MSHGIRRYLRETRFTRKSQNGDELSSNPNKRRADLFPQQSSDGLKSTNPIDPWGTGWEEGSNNDWTRSGGGYKSVSAPAFSLTNKQNNLQKDTNIDNTLLP